METVPPRVDLPEQPGPVISGPSGRGRAVVLAVATACLLLVAFLVSRLREEPTMPVDPDRAFAGCTSFEREDCVRIAGTIGEELAGRGDVADADTFVRGLTSLRVYPAGDEGAWVMASYRLDERSTRVGTAVVRRSFLGLGARWGIVGGFFVNRDPPPARGSGNTWFDPVGLRREGVPDALIGFADPDVTTVQTFAAGGVRADEEIPQGGFFVIDMPLPGQVAFWEGNRLLSTQALAQGTPGQASSSPVSEDETPADALDAGGEMAAVLLDRGAAGIPHDVWVDATSQGGAEALSAILRPGEWQRTGPSASSVLEGSPLTVTIAYPVEGPAGSGYLRITIQRVDDHWRLRSPAYIADRSIFDPLNAS
jgi:hypothetical protein